MLEQQRTAYALKLHRHSGTVERLTVPGDPEGLNLINRGTLTGFGVLAWTPRGEKSAWLAPSGPPLNVESVHLDERRSFAAVVRAEENRVVCHNPVTGHSLTYVFNEDYFDLWLEGDLPDADQVALDLDVGFMDLRQNDPPEYQYAVQSPYRSLDRSLCYVFLARPKPPGMLLTCLTPAAGWRLRYGRAGAFPPAYRVPTHAVLGLQLAARFHSTLDPESHWGPVKFGVRISFPKNLGEAEKAAVAYRQIPLPTAPMPGGECGSVLPFQIYGPAGGAELTGPDGGTQNISLRQTAVDLNEGEVLLEREGFYTLRTWNQAGESGDLILHAGTAWLETLRRSLNVLTPTPPTNAEGSYWAHAMCLARQWLGPDRRHEAFLYDALVRIHMQGLAAPSAMATSISEPTIVARQMPQKDGRFLNAPLPEPHLFRGKRFSAFHLYEHDRVQDAFALIQLYLLAAEAYACDDFFAQAVRVAEAHVADNVDANGRVYCLTKDGKDTHDYTSVICPLQALIDLVRALRKRGDPRAADFHRLAARTADYLVQRGLDFPTEGVSPHGRWTEDGSISCTALALAYAYWHLERRAEWLQTAGMVLDYHEAWGLSAPDVRMHGSSYRYWETQWEGDGEGRALNAGHAWTLWRAEALYYWALAVGDARRLLQSWNGFETNRCKYHPNGTTYACFTPDFLPDRPRRFALTHSYPKNPDRSLAFYLWPRAAETWLRTAAIIGPGASDRAPNSGPFCLNGTLTREADGVFRLIAHAPFFDRLFLLDPTVQRLRVKAARPVETLYADKAVQIEWY